MPANSPADLHPIFQDAFNRGDADALLALYEPDAVLVAQPGTSARGHAEIRQALGAFLALQGTIVLDTIGVYEADGLALVHGRWTITAKGQDGQPLELKGVSSEVVRRQPDGSWLYILDNPATGA